MSLLDTAIGGLGTNLEWVTGPVAPQNQLSAAAFVYSPFIPCAGQDQLGIHVKLFSNALTVGSWRLRWSPTGAVADAFDEVVEAAAAIVVGPPAVAPFDLYIKQWGPVPSDTVANGGRKYTIIRPAVAHFFALGVIWGGAPAATDRVTMWVERQSGGQLQGPAS